MWSAAGRSRPAPETAWHDLPCGRNYGGLPACVAPFAFGADSALSSSLRTSHTRTVVAPLLAALGGGGGALAARGHRHRVHFLLVDREQPDRHRRRASRAERSPSLVASHSRRRCRRHGRVLLAVGIAVGELPYGAAAHAEVEAADRAVIRRSEEPRAAGHPSTRGRRCTARAARRTPSVASSAAPTPTADVPLLVARDDEVDRG